MRSRNRVQMRLPNRYRNAPNYEIFFLSVTIRRPEIDCGRLQYNKDKFLLEEHLMSEPKMKLNAVYEVAKEQNKKQLCRFMQDMRRADLPKQRVFITTNWRGPVPRVVCEDVESVIFANQCPLFVRQKGA